MPIFLPKFVNAFSTLSFIEDIFCNYFFATEFVFMTVRATKRHRLDAQLASYRVVTEGIVLENIGDGISDFA